MAPSLVLAPARRLRCCWRCDDGEILIFSGFDSAFREIQGLLYMYGQLFVRRLGEDESEAACSAEYCRIVMWHIDFQLMCIYI